MMHCLAPTHVLDTLQTFGVAEEDYAKALHYQSKHGGSIEKLLVNMGSLSEDRLVHLYAALFGLNFADFSNYGDTWSTPNLTQFGIVDSDLLDYKECGWLPLSITNDNDQLRITWLTFQPTHAKMLQVMHFIEAQHDVLLCEQIEFQQFVLNTESQSPSVTDNVTLSEYEEDKLRELASEAPTVNLLNSLITKAINQHASDMHLEPINGRLRVRFRIDGVLHDIEYVPARLEVAIISRLKILSGMDIAEKRRPQDGKIELKIANTPLDIRVSALPLAESESVVMRFLRKDSVQYDFSVLGLSNDTEQSIREDLQHTAGVILLTGPTGSGKTTTLYTFLNELNDDKVKIITLEDPVEYQLPGLNQVQIKPEIDFDFARGLRSIVRQDPDIIMVGEIRDSETCRIAMQAALTGHLVLSTVHTNDAPSAYTRLLDLGVQEFLLNAGLVSIIAQRLARQLCSECAEAAEDAEALLAKYKLRDLAHRFHIEDVKLMQPNGCEACNYSGYNGRFALIEYLRCDEVIKSLPKDSNFIAKAKTHNAKSGHRTLIEDGFIRACLGKTTIAEVIRVCG